MQVYKIVIKKIRIDIVDVTHLTHVNIVWKSSGATDGSCHLLSVGSGLQDEVPHIEAELRAGGGQEVVQEARQVREAGGVQVPGERLLFGEQGAGGLGLAHPGAGVGGVGALVWAGQRAQCTT